MKAIVQDSYGSADVLKLGEVEQPTIGDGELLVRVHAAGVDRGVWHLMTGLPYLIRIMGYGLRAPRTRVPGNDFAGRVEAIGASVTHFKPGDEVFGICAGSFAEYACVKEDRLARKPQNLTFEQAAAVPVSACTALDAVRDKGDVQAGQRVLIVGASGGVGTFAVQLAKACGAHVIGVCSAAKADLVRSIGADQIIDYTQQDFTRGSQRYDVVLDIGGNRSLSRLRRILAPRGTLVIIGGEEGGRLLGGTERLLGALLLSPFVGQKLRGFIATAPRAKLEFLAELIEAGKLTPVVDRAYPLSEAAQAMRHLEQGQARGKLVLRVSGADS